jgi:hypothetical protein
MWREVFHLIEDMFSGGDFWAYWRIQQLNFFSRDYQFQNAVVFAHGVFNIKYGLFNSSVSCEAYISNLCLYSENIILFSRY